MPIDRAFSRRALPSGARRRHEHHIAGSGSFRSHSVAVASQELRVNAFVPFDNKDGMVALNQVPHSANHRNLMLLHIGLHQRDAMRKRQFVQRKARDRPIAISANSSLEVIGDACRAARHTEAKQAGALRHRDVEERNVAVSHGAPWRPESRPSPQSVRKQSIAINDLARERRVSDMV